MKNFLRIFTILIFIISINTSSWAEIIKYEFTGHITSANFAGYIEEYVNGTSQITFGSIDAGIYVDDVFTGVFTYDTEATEYGLGYWSPHNHLEISLTTSQPSAWDFFPVMNTSPIIYGNPGAMDISSYVEGGMSDTFQWWLDICKNGLFHYSVDNWGTSSIGTVDIASITGVIDTVVIPTPEPATLLLFSSGLLGFAGLKKKYSKNN